MKVTSFKPADIFQLVAEGKIPSQAWLAEKLFIKATTFNKMLNHGKDIPGAVNEKINEVLKKEGIITDTSDQCNLLIKQTMHTDSIIGQSLCSLNEITIQLAGDNELSFDDKKKLIEHYEAMSEEINEKIYQLIRIVKGRK